MSNRTLLEFNHDYVGDIERDPDRFVQQILQILRSGKNQQINGVTYHGQRHHTEGYNIQWGSYWSSSP